MASDRSGGSSRRNTGLVCDRMNFAAKEAFKRLRTNITVALPENGGGCHIIGMTSALPFEGKSTVAVNLAYSLAAGEHKVLLIDGDLRRPSVHTKLELEAVPGLTELLKDAKSVTASTRTYFSKDGFSFDIIPAGELPNNPSELLNSERMRKLLATLAKVYDYIVIDLPPVGAVIDAISVGKYIEGMAVVVREKNCLLRMLDDCLDQLSFAGIRVLGFAVNGSQGFGKSYSRYKYGGYSSYGYGSYGGYGGYGGYGYGYGYGNYYGGSGRQENSKG